MKRLLAPALAAAALASPAHAQSTTMFNATVESVLDGDNILVTIDGQLKQVNLSGIYPPIDSRQNWDEIARQGLEQFVKPGDLVRVELVWQTDTRIYGYVYSSDGAMVNVNMLREGLSLIYQQPVDDVIGQMYIKAASEAKNNGLGYYQAPVVAASGDTVGLDPNAFRTTDATFTSIAAAPPWAALGSALSANSTNLAIGSGAAVLAVAAVTLLRIRHKSPATGRMSVGKMRRELKQTRQMLASTLIDQKQLQSQYQQALQNAQTWLSRAESALRNNDQDLARSALVRKKEFVMQAEAVKQRLEGLDQQVVILKADIATLENQVSLSTLRR